MSKSDSEDTTFFHEQMRGVKRLKKTNRVSTLIRPSGTFSQREKASLKKISQLIENDVFQFSDHLQETVTSATTLSFAQAGMPEKVLRDLRLGKIAQTKILDLHGSTIAQARTQLSRFLTISLKQEQRCVRIIHGKGKLDVKEPALKNHVNSWLRQHPAVLAFHSTTPRDGGTGAVYVLLKRQKLKEIV